MPCELDLIGDVHGCYDELCLLLERLGYRLNEEDGGLRVLPPAGRRVLFLGDLIDRGPRCPEVVLLVMDMVEAGSATCLFGNHEYQFLECLAGRFPVAWGLEETFEQLERHPPELTDRLRRFAEDLPHQLTLDEGRLVVAHAGMPRELQGVDSPESRQFALYSNPESTRRLDWAPDYDGEARVVYGHTPTDHPTWVNGTLCLDTGCVYGGSLTALRYPEMEIVSVAARRCYYEGA